MFLRKMILEEKEEKKFSKIKRGDDELIEVLDFLI